jgi:hypothetical protein
MVPKRKNPGPWKVHEPEPTPPTNGKTLFSINFYQFMCLKLKFY